VSRARASRSGRGERRTPLSLLHLNKRRWCDDKEEEEEEEEDDDDDRPSSPSLLLSNPVAVVLTEDVPSPPSNAPNTEFVCSIGVEMMGRGFETSRTRFEIKRNQPSYSKPFKIYLFIDLL